MGLAFDLHVHTRRYSPCSSIDPERLVARAARMGLDGLVITEHHRQWTPAELACLTEKARVPGFVLLAGFEYTSAQGDVLIYGLEAAAADEFRPGWPPERAIELAARLGGVCVAAHPTRAGLGFDERILTLDLAAIEVQSVNMRPHEQRLAMKLAHAAGTPALAASDAHRAAEIGRHKTEFTQVVQSMPELQDALKHGRFRMLEVEDQN